MSDETDVAWCAGFLDGEGTFGFAKQGGSRHGDRRKGFVSADQIRREPLDKLARVIGGSVSGPIRRTSAGNPIYRWILRGNASDVLPLLIPHLTIKRAKAELLLAHALTFNRSHRTVPDEILAERRRLEDLLKGSDTSGS